MDLILFGQSSKAHVPDNHPEGVPDNNLALPILLRSQFASLPLSSVDESLNTDARTELLHLLIVLEHLDEHDHIYDLAEHLGVNV